MKGIHRSLMHRIIINLLQITTFLCRVIQSLSSTFALPIFLLFCVITPGGDGNTAEELLDVTEAPDLYSEEELLLSAIITVMLLSSS